MQNDPTAPYEAARAAGSRAQRRAMHLPVFRSPDTAPGTARQPVSLEYGLGAAFNPTTFIAEQQARLIAAATAAAKEKLAVAAAAITSAVPVSAKTAPSVAVAPVVAKTEPSVIAATTPVPYDLPAKAPVATTPASSPVPASPQQAGWGSGWGGIIAGGLLIFAFMGLVTRKKAR